MRVFLLLTILFFSFSSFSQKNITGRITKTGGGVLAGVKITAKGAPSIFTLSDENGKYRIEIPEEVTALVFSYSGMATKTVKIKEFNTVNVKLTPAKYKAFRFGAGMAAGASKFSVFTADYADTVVINMTPFSLHADMFYRINKSAEIQLIVEDGFNGAKIPTDSITETGDTVEVTQKTGVNRFTVSLLANYHVKLDKTGNTSLFVGLGPQYQYLSFLKTQNVGIRFNIGVNVNNYGFTTKFYFASDFASGKFNEENIFIAGYPYRYSSGRFGVVFIF